MNREDFEVLNNGYIYFDNGATTFKPKCVLYSIKDYYTKYTANAHRGDYDFSLIVDEKYENTRSLVKDFINAKKAKEIIFTSGATMSLNQIIFGYFKNYLKKDDEVLITKAEHASNILPWFELENTNQIKVNYIPLNENHILELETLKKSITNHTKVISIAHITNVVGDIRPIREIIKYAHERNILVVVDGAQSVPHLKINVQDLDIDFLAFSAHKMLGPTGVGIMYAKEEFLNNMTPLAFGGGMNASFVSDGTRQYKDIPYLFEAGTQNIEGVIAFGEAISYLNKIGMDKIENYEKNLKEYALKRLKEIDDIIIYNENTESGIIAFNYKDVFAQDLAVYLNKYKICVRAGNHCAKILKDEIGIKNTCRLSFYLYNTYEEIDKLIEVLKNPHLKEELF